MGEISFGFKAIPEPRRETAFKYQYADSIEYGFTYERCIALSDTSIFNNPVSIIKVAMGLSALYPLFVDKMAHSSRYHSLTSEFNKVSDILSDNSKQQDYSINKTHHTTKELSQSSQTHKSFPYDFTIYDKESLLKKKDGIDFNIFDYLNLARPRNKMRIYELPYGFEKYFEFRIIKNDLFLKRYL